MNAPRRKHRLETRKIQGIPHAGWSRRDKTETLRLGQRLGLGRASEWSLVGEFADRSRVFVAGYEYRFGFMLGLGIEATRRQAPNDDVSEHSIMLRAGMRW